MFIRILKKDLMRKKTMNIILLMFVVLSTMFASSSVNNMISVFGGIDYYYEKAGMPDFVALTRNVGGEDPVEEVIKNASSVTDFQKEEIFFYQAKNLLKDGEKYAAFENVGVITSIEDAKLNYFDRNNEVITDIKEGHVYVSGILADPQVTTIGDVVDFELEGVKLSFTVDGYAKDALLGSPFLGNPRMLISEKDMQKLRENDNVQSNFAGAIYYVSTDDLKALQNEMASLTNALFARETSLIRMTYMLDMITAGILMSVSICLIMVAFAMLSFTIKFTLNEDFCEIGVMKAVGLKNRSIRGLYMTKYLCLSLVGAVIGYLASIPFGDLMLKSVSGRLVIGNDAEILTGLVSAVAVVGIILLFCYHCTGGIKKLSPIDAVHNGETGERYQRRSALKLGRSILPGDLFLAVNDVLSKPKQYLSMIVTFTICLLMIMMLGTTANTLMSENLLFLLGTTKSDVYYSNTDNVMTIMGNPDENIASKLRREIEEKLSEEGMPGKVHQELDYTLTVTFQDRRSQIVMQQCKDTKASEYTYDRGSAPMYENEVAFTPQVMEELGTRIGDKVWIEVSGEPKECIITATFSSLNQIGKCGRLHEDFPIKETDATSGFPYQIDFDDSPSEAVIADRIEKMKDFLKEKEIYNVKGFVDDSTKSSGPVLTARNLVLLISVVISMLISVLMERSFISKETGEIALMKAIGFKNRSIVLQHTLRFATVMGIALVFAMILNYPFTKLIDDRIFAAMGALSGIRYKIKPFEIFCIYPLILTIPTVSAALCTALYTKTIHADSMGNIE